MKTSETGKHRRRAMRLAEYDYRRAGAYFLTICAHDRQCMFGHITGGVMQLNPFGAVVREVWNELTRHYAYIELDAFVVMPNHVHGIIIFVDDVDDVGAGLKPAHDRAGLRPAPTGLAPVVCRGVGAGLKPARNRAGMKPAHDRAGLRPAHTERTLNPTKPGRIKRHGLPEIVRAFKSFSARRINEIRLSPAVPVWQRNYYEHVIRDVDSLNRIREYIVNNPARWADDKENPDGARQEQYQ